MDNAIQTEQVETPSKGYRVFKIVRTVFIYLLAAVVIIAAILFAASNSPSKSLFGYRYYTVLTPSMEPAYSVGDMVFVKIENADKINVGDVITFNPSEDSEAYLTHRVVEKLPDYEGSGVTCFRTKGDANDSEDSFLIDEDRVIGPVKFAIPKLGYVVRFVQLRWYLIVPLIALIEKVKTTFGSGDNTDDINDFDIIVYSESVQTTEIDSAGTVYTDADWKTAWKSFLT